MTDGRRWIDFQDLLVLHADADRFAASELNADEYAEKRKTYIQTKQPRKEF